MMLRPGERVIDEARFLARNTAYAANLKRWAKEAAQDNLDTYHKLKKQNQSIADSFTGTENFV